MKSAWPETITLRFKCVGANVLGILVFVVLISRKKNNFSVGPLLVDQNGEIILRAERLRKFIEEEKHEYPMDYDGGLEDCRGFELIVESEESLWHRADRLRKYYPKAADELEKKIRECNNKKFVALKKRWDFPIEGDQIEVELTVSRPSVR